MTTLSIKIVGIEEDSVLVKFASENSAKPIDEYGAIAYQPKNMGYSSIDEFIEGIKPNLLNLVTARDNSEQSSLDLNEWQDYQTSVTVEPIINPELASVIIEPSLPSQVINISEVIL